MMADDAILHTVMGAIARYSPSLKLMILATAKAQEHKQLATQYGITLILEAFADRQYTDEGQLVSRNIAGSVHNKVAILAQVNQLLIDGTVTTNSGNKVTLNADSLCVHGDNADGIALIKDIKALCINAKS
eukprot:TRINITY_DN2159_c0_g1_i2.p1 TRINITY_DN2159_c0_g1~~TRINITY_DN2159_c0_g1_i2.p1  ORF type:complete len:131 (+),score=22.10 TRINITY_DN2159_c0_g1_i2:48-440(+)